MCSSTIRLFLRLKGEQKSCTIWTFIYFASPKHRGKFRTVINKIRNIAIIAHVDHGKTTLVDELLKQSGTLDSYNLSLDRVMDSNDIEKERGITILSKNTAISWKGHHINIVDTPGHADFGGEVERVLSMVDSVLLLVDAVEGPMPQTRFVTQKAFAMGLKPIVVINKIDRDGGRPDWVLDQTFELFDRLDATDDQLDFTTIYASALKGFSSTESTVREGTMEILLDTIVDEVPHPDVDLDGPFQLQISSLDYNNYLGVIGIGRVKRGRLSPNGQIVVVDQENNQRKARVLKFFRFLGLNKIDLDEAYAGDIVAFCGVENIHISDTICDPECVEVLKPLSVDEPTVTVTFQVNNSPFAGKEGKYVTSRRIKERLEQELLHNVALKVEETGDPDKFQVSGRGELHLSILIENMRREGFELAVSRPEVIIHEDADGNKTEPYEQLTVDVEEQHQGTIMEQLGIRKGDLKNISMGNKGRVRLDYIIPARGLIGFRSSFLTLTSGTGLMYHVFENYGPYLNVKLGNRTNGVLISNASGKAIAYSLFTLQERGRLFAKNADPVYEGMIIGIHSRTNDLTVNPTKAKQLTNVRASGTDESLVCSPPIVYTLEQAMEFIDDDELVEVTPKSIRIRKRYLKEHERKRASRSTIVR